MSVDSRLRSVSRIGGDDMAKFVWTTCDARTKLVIVEAATEDEAFSKVLTHLGECYDESEPDARDEYVAEMRESYQAYWWIHELAEEPL